MGDLVGGAANGSAFSTSDTAIPDGEQEIGTVRFTVGSGVAVGSYPVTITGFNFLDGSNYTPVANVTFNVKVVSRHTVVLDETSTTTPTAATDVNVTVRRSIQANQWSTICLPFAMTEAQVKAAFGDDVQLAEFKGTEPEFDDNDNVVGITVSFDDVTAIEANHPYIIKVSEPIAEFTADGVDIDADEDGACVEFDNGKNGARRVVYSGFYGTYHAGTVLDKYSLFLSDNKFWYSAGNTKMKAFRAYFDFLDILTEVETANARISLSFNGSETAGISTKLNSECIKHNEVYDLQGRRVSGAGANSSLFTIHSSLKKGLYIRNGRKEVVR